MIVPAPDEERMPSHADGQDWLTSWHAPPDPPDGTPHGAAGVCVAGDDQLVLISSDGVYWGFPGGRPEAGESAEDTLRREVHEEACAIVKTARLLGFARGECVNGWERGKILVRSYWRAEVEIEPWEPRFEIPHRRLITLTEASARVRDPNPVGTRIAHRALREAGL